MTNVTSATRILAVSDEISTSLYNADVLRQHASDVRFILSCGDLPVTYLDFIASVLCRQLYFVRGNHFWEFSRQGGGSSIGIDLDGRVVNACGILLGGLEGSMRYKPGGAQYTDSEMWRKVIQMMPRLLLNRWRYGRAIDILATHAAPFGIHDRPDRTHRGFRAFLRFMEWFKPRYLLHGHVHVWDSREITQTRYLYTEVINVYPWRIIDFEHEPEPCSDQEPAPPQTE